MWTAWNESSQSLNFGHYNLKSIEDCEKVFEEFYFKDRNRGTLAFGLGFLNIPCQTLKSTGFDSILKEAEGRNRKDGKENTGLKTRYSAKELLER